MIGHMPDETHVRTTGATVVLALAVAGFHLTLAQTASGRAGTAPPPSAQGSGSQPSRASIAVAEPTFVAIRVRDVGAMDDWYSRTFGLDRRKTLDGEGGAFSIRILGNETLTVELIEQNGTEDAPDRHIGLFKIGFYVDDATQSLAQLRALGAVAPDQDVTVFVDEPLGVRTFVVRDPEGNRLQFFERCGDAC